MNSHVGGITLGVRDLDRAKKFYADGLGWAIHQEYPGWISFVPHQGSSMVGLYQWDALAADAGVAAEGSGFRGVTFSYIVRSQERVDAVLDEAKRAGGTIVRPGEKAQWGGYFGYFADPDGYLWKIAHGEGEQPFGE